MRYIEMGQSVYDIITGFSGIVTGRCEYITGCTQYLVQPKHIETYQEGRWFDEDRLLVDSTKDKIVLDSRTNGSDMPAPVK